VNPERYPACGSCGYGAAVIDGHGHCRACAAELDGDDFPADPALDERCDERAYATVARQLAVDARAACMRPPPSPVAIAYATWAVATPAAYRDRPARLLATARANSTPPGVRRDSDPQAPTVRPGAAQPTRPRDWRAVVSFRAEAR
jgi:hypothetical protein